MHEKLYINKKWKFTDSFEGALLIEPMKEDVGVEVELPHVFREVPFNYIHNEQLLGQCVYQRSFFAGKEWKGKRLILNFEGVAWRAGVYINGVNLIIHEGGSTPFSVDIDSKVNFGEDNLITVVVDSRYDVLNQPPFSGGGPVDVPPFGGIYREVYLTVKDRISMGRVSYRATTTLPPDTKGMTRERLESYTIQGRLETSIELSDDAVRMAKEHRLHVRQFLNENEISYQPLSPNGETVTVTGPVKIWDIDSPTCYRVQTDLIFDNIVIDTNVSTIGFRTAVFDQSGFYLNGRKVKLRGVVRQQTYPYVGYAMPESIQRHDAKILKEELHVNAVRCCGEYPSPYFLQECDSRGILVFCEVPGYRNLGDESFHDIHLKNVEEMIIEGRNHPSIFLWGVRINGSVSSDIDRRAVELAHSLDPTRPTSGEHLERESAFYEDVYAYTDLSFSGRGTPLLSKEEVTPDMGRPYLISGYLGESMVVRPSDSDKRKAAQVMYASAILDAVGFSEDICGSFAYSMCDHQSMAEFAAEDGIAYHGILDSFRNKKPVASVFSSQNNPVGEISVFPPLSGDRERWEGFGEVYIVTNAEKVRVYRDDQFVCEYDKNDSPFTHMRHGPILMNDFLGDIFNDSEDIRSDQAKRLKKILNQMAIGGLSSFLQPGQMVDRFLSKIVYRTSRRQLQDLYESYVSKSHTFRFDGLREDEVIASTTLAPNRRKYLRADASSINLIEKHSYDVVSVRMRVSNESGEVLGDYAEPIMLETTGPIELIGPKIVPLRGGMAGTYIRSVGEEGEAVLKAYCGDLTPVEISFTILRAPQAELG